MCIYIYVHTDAKMCRQISLYANWENGKTVYVAISFLIKFYYHKKYWPYLAMEEKFTVILIMM